MRLFNKTALRTSVAAVAVAAAALLTSCERGSSNGYTVVHRTAYWDCLKLNDSTILCIPTAEMGDSGMSPTLLIVK